MGKKTETDRRGFLKGAAGLGAAGCAAAAGCATAAGCAAAPWRKWNCVLEYDSARKVTSGSPEALREAVRKGADLRIYTGFQHNEHIDVRSKNDDRIQEVSDFPCTYLLDSRWVAAMMTFRQPVQLPGTFGPRASMSFFMYNENGLQSIARPFLDGGECDPSAKETPILMEKYHVLSSFDEGTNAPSANFVYDFFSYRFLVNECWQEICSVDENGHVLSGSPRDLEAASLDGCELKVGIDGVCGGDLKHTMFVQTGPHYFYHREGCMVAETRPFVRVKPAIPLQYASHNWDFGWNVVRSDGNVAGLYYDPYTLKPFRTFERHPVRWFVR